MDHFDDDCDLDMGIGDAASRARAECDQSRANLFSLSGESVGSVACNFFVESLNLFGETLSNSMKKWFGRPHDLLPGKGGLRCCRYRNRGSELIYFCSPHVIKI